MFNIICYTHKEGETINKNIAIASSLFLSCKLCVRIFTNGQYAQVKWLKACFWKGICEEKNPKGSKGTTFDM